MKKAGKSVLLATVMLLIAASTSNAKGLDKISLVTAQKSSDICQSPLKPYVILESNECPPVNERQVQFIGNIKINKADEFSVAHSISSATYTPTPTPEVIVSEVRILTPAPTIIVSEQTVTHVGNDSNVVFDLVNQHRESIGKPAFIKDDALCSLAQTRSNELAGEISRGVLHSGLYNRDLGYWITENAKTGGDEAETVRWWLNSSIHRKQIQSDYTNACVGCTGKNCSLLFTSYTPKGSLASSKEE